ncbi:hypothetical protein GGH94_005541 [Coemansia aciculifera]|uniref:Thioredoxin n=1 Tax=Coemansia aciculifera TaxID=417176 RepID=A0A9W8IDA1_9FUNG|nr:hypothetical protein GGH94_005541 [Coemansia aciculifera]KAJ2870568.1 hypothetical protein GGH93_005472 [Coemansia aciculifera]
MPVISVDDSDHFYHLLNSHQKVVVDFTASWCGPCRQMSPIFSDLSGEHSDVLFLSVDIDNVRDVAQAYSVTSLPTFKFFYGRREYNTVIGANRWGLEYGIQSL